MDKCKSKMTRTLKKPASLIYNLWRNWDKFKKKKRKKISPVKLPIVLVIHDPDFNVEKCYHLIYGRNMRPLDMNILQ